MSMSNNLSRNASESTTQNYNYDYSQANSNNMANSYNTSSYTLNSNVNSNVNISSPLAAGEASRVVSSMGLSNQANVASVAGAGGVLAGAPDNTGLYLAAAAAALGLIVLAKR